jgi:PhnB protein
MAQQEMERFQQPITPHLTVSPAADAIRFYEKAFGATLLFRQDTPDGKRVLHASMKLPNGGVFMLNDEFPEFGGPDVARKGSSVTIHLDFPKDVDSAWKKAVGAGGNVVMELADQFWGDRYGILKDPYGQQWSLATHIRNPSPEEMAAATKEMFGS